MTFMAILDFSFGRTRLRVHIRVFITHGGVDVLVFCSSVLKSCGGLIIIYIFALRGLSCPALPCSRDGHAVGDLQDQDGGQGAGGSPALGYDNSIR